jgi:hypothetical protein
MPSVLNDLSQVVCPCWSKWHYLALAIPTASPFSTSSGWTSNRTCTVQMRAAHCEAVTTGASGVRRIVRLPVPVDRTRTSALGSSSSCVPTGQERATEAHGVRQWNRS